VSVKVVVDGVVGAVEVLDDELPPQPTTSVHAVAPAAVAKKVLREIPFCFKCVGPGFTGKTPFEKESAVLALPAVVHKGNGSEADLDSQTLPLLSCEQKRHCI
jgi:hypothetical protein